MENRKAVRDIVTFQNEFLDALKIFRKGPKIKGHKTAHCFLPPTDKNEKLDTMLCSAYVGDVARRASALDIALHTVQVSVGGETATHAVCEPLGLDTPQRMYSVSKTVTGLAIGLLAGEGALSLDDPIAAHFPEMAPVHPWLEATTIRHMLAMRGPHRSTTYKRTDGGWLESYFRVRPTHPPGTVFTYDTSASYVLAALTERLTGTSLPDYLRPRLLDPLAISPDLRFLTGPEDISHGGSGLICTPRDLLRLAHLLLGDGVHDGVRLLPADYVRAATRPQADTALQTWGASLREGYGYQLWLPRRGGWLMFGLGGQIVYGDPARGLVVVVTADSQACASGDQRLLDDVLDGLVRPLADRLDAGVADDAGSRNGSSTAVTLSWPAPRHDAVHARPVSGRYVNVVDGPGPAELVLKLTDVGGRLRGVGDQAATGGWDVELRYDRPVRTRVDDQPAVVTAGWTGGDTLDVRCALLGDDLTTWRARLAWAPDGSLAVQSQVFGESADEAWNFHAAYRPAP
ncbi:beta-lactamase family protein [Streptomyces sp. PSKA54]|uniref:Beta-lactamase family protein n=1 Tax=Streptomyces himalayensis subsp. aureolus TaxID=2758039 RepID=A0A7W2D919_9ACTN|nr:serine hydrolase domain-containing protein [Streptomyces himalayensis]MBA4866740.1 beta-lactamase family protein [Streptomyces himalayensis subsp. aureolus]